MLPIDDLDNATIAFLSRTIIPRQAVEHIAAGYFKGIEGVERVTIVGIVEMATPCEVRHCQATHLQRVIDLPRGIDFFQAVLC